MSILARGKIRTRPFEASLVADFLGGRGLAMERAEKLIRLWDEAKGEVVIDLEIMEVSRTKLRQLGVSLDSNTIEV